MVFDHGVLINSYRADNGVFQANEFVAHISDQKISLCGVNGRTLGANGLRVCPSTPTVYRLSLVWRDNK